LSPERKDALDRIEWGVAALPRRGETAMGDRHIVKPFADGVLLGAVDGLGHGAEAAKAARMATAVLEDSAAEPVTQLLQRCHDRLSHTRGVAVCVASLTLPDQVMTWLGVGNVQAIVLHLPTPESGPRKDVMIPSPGVVGYRFPTLRPASIKLLPGDVAIFATDGVEAHFTTEFRPIGTSQRMADLILAQYGKDTDDALVLVVRLLRGNGQ
jgi:phosphoserine phosphatase RsbX